MRLTTYTDYALRVLLYAGAANETVTIARISKAYGISREHLRKVVHTLAQLGYLETSQGRNGGLRLARPPEEINLGEVVAQVEPGMLVECFDADTNTCPIDGMCGLKHVLREAQRQFQQVLHKYYLSDMLKNPRLVRFSQEDGVRPLRMPE